MLNPDLKLNPKLFDADCIQAPTRDGFGQALVALGEINKNVVVLCADLTDSTRCDAFAKKFPERFFECGVAEQNMAAVAAGLAESGKIPFICSYATFSPGKNWETIRTTIVYNKANVKIAGHHSGIVTGPDGATHQATEDIAIMRALPGIYVTIPCDSIEAKKISVASAGLDWPFYIRFTRDKTPIITTDETPFEIGRVQKYWVCDNPQAVIFGTGHLLYQALLAAKELEGENINVLVANVATIKPLDDQTIVDLAGQAGAAVTVEDHQINGGLGGAIAELLARKKPTPIEFIGLQNTFAESGTPADLIKKYKLDAAAIKQSVISVISRKNN